MKVFATLATLALLWSAAPVFAQTPAPAAPAAQGAQGAQGATTPATPAQAPPAAAKPPVPFPADSKIGYVQLGLISQNSAAGKEANARFQAETKKKSAEAEARMKKMQADQQKLETGGTLMAAEARANLEKDIQKQQVDGERFEQDAQAELNNLQQQLQKTYNDSLFPALEAVAKEFKLQLLFGADGSGLVWAEPGLNLSMEVVKRMDSTPKPAASTTSAPPAAARPSATPASTPPRAPAIPPGE